MFEQLGFQSPAEAYLDDVEALQSAGSEWHRLHAAELGPLHFELPKLENGCVCTGNLDLAESLGWPRNKAARHFVRFIDERTKKRGTLLMLQVLMFLQEVATATKVNAAGGAS